MVGKKWTKQEVFVLQKHYGNHTSRQELMKLLPNRSYDAISMKAFFLGLKGDKRNSNRKHEIKFNAFSKTDTNSAYWAGFIAADGHLTPENQLCLKLSDKDKNHLRAFRKYIGYTGKIKTANRLTNYGNFSSVELRCQCRDICDDLNIIFDIPKGKKSDILKLPDIKMEFLIDFIAGYFDGDGCLYKDKRGYLTITFVGNKDFLQQLQKVINKYFNIETSVPYKNTQHSDAFLYRIHGAKAELVLKRFKQNKNSLKRKRL